MFIEYDDYRLLELFESEPIYLPDEESGILMYIKEDDFGFKLILTISIYERTCDLSLNYCKFSKPVFEGNFQNIGRILATEDELKLVYDKDNTIAASLSFKTNFLISMNEK
ncbi:hypothetical protein L2089_20735 [Paenibacillus hunanensis]|uniref:hypothetical protein n=1 Tax=Paenibacillus hunanensis TaxID=539262 RepID=UPI002025DC5F|nr:hypothetical protein [Paenibacillus hunanensis]MCL9663114.1 hypothetical protein [Paenibacillus hunanensis]